MNWLTKTFKPKQVKQYISTAVNNFLKADPKTSAFIHTNSGYVYAAVRAISEATARLNLELYERQKGAYKPVDQHRILSFFERPNASMSFYDLIYSACADLNLSGNAYWYLKQGQGQLKEVIPLAASRVMARIENGMIKEYRYSVGSSPTVIPISHIVHFKILDNDDPMGLGKSPISALYNTLLNEANASAKQLAVYQNSTNPSGVLKVDKRLTQDELTKLRTDWTNNYGDVDNSGKTMILEGGLQYQQIEINPQFLDLLDNRRFNKEVILAVFRVPGHILGDNQTTNRATAQSEEAGFYRQVITPLMTRIVDTMNMRILPFFESNPRYKLGFADASPPDKELRIQEYDKGVGKYITVNEARATLNLPPKTGGDKLFRPALQQSIEVDVERRIIENDRQIRMLNKNKKEWTADDWR